MNSLGHNGNGDSDSDSNKANLNFDKGLITPTINDRSRSQEESRLNVEC